MTGCTGVMLLVIGSTDERSSQGFSVAARTIAVQAEVTSGCMINIMVSPVTTYVTGGTGVRVAETIHIIDQTMAIRAAFERVGRRIVTGGTAVMDLGIARVGEAGCRVGVTHQTGGLAGDKTGGDVINAVIDIRDLGGVTGGTGHAGVVVDEAGDRGDRWGLLAVVGRDIVVTGGTGNVLVNDIGEARQSVAVRIVTNRAALLGGL